MYVGKLLCCFCNIHTCYGTSAFVLKWCTHRAERAIPKQLHRLRDLTIFAMCRVCERRRNQTWRSLEVHRRRVVEILLANGSSHTAYMWIFEHICWFHSIYVVLIIPITHVLHIHSAVTQGWLPTRVSLCWNIFFSTRKIFLKHGELVSTTTAVGHCLIVSPKTCKCG